MTKKLFARKTDSPMRDFLLDRAFTLFELRPGVLVVTPTGGKLNVRTASWMTLLGSTPMIFDCGSKNNYGISKQLGKDWNASKSLMNKD